MLWRAEVELVSEERAQHLRFSRVYLRSSVFPISPLPTNTPRIEPPDEGG